MAPIPRSTRWALLASGALLGLLLPPRAESQPFQEPSPDATPQESTPAAPDDLGATDDLAAPEDLGAVEDTPLDPDPLPEPDAGPDTSADADPAPPLTEASGEPELPLELELTANQLTYDRRLQRFVATGNVKAMVARGRLLADRIEYDADSRTVLARGSVRLQRGQQYLQASRLRYSLLEGVGEMDDVYGIIDLDGSVADFDFDTVPSQELAPPESIACPPELPPPPDWTPYPWAVTAWGGQSIDSNFGDTFLFNGRMRPEYFGGLGLQRRLLRGGPIAIELDTNLLGHRANRQAGGEFNQRTPFADTPAQSFAEITAGLGVRVWLQPWLNLYFVEGVSVISEASNYERTFRESYARLLNYLAFEVEALVTPQISAVGRIHHRSGAYGTFSGVREGSNAYLVGLRYRFGHDPSEPRFRTPLPPALGCPDAPREDQHVGGRLGERLGAVALGLPFQDESDGSVAAPAPRPSGNAWQRARVQQSARDAAIRRIDQRVEDVTFRQSLIAERRIGFPNEFTRPDDLNEFGGVRPEQLRDQTTKSNRELVRGSISRWRIQAKQVTITPEELRADRAGLSNDPFTPAQSWLEAENLSVRLNSQGETLLRAQRSRVLLEDRLPIPVAINTRLGQDEVENRLVLGADTKDRDGFFLGYNLKPITIGERGQLSLQPQFMIQRAIDGSTNSYPLPGQSAGDPSERQSITAGDLFGLRARLEMPLAGFDADANVDLSTLSPENFANGTRSWGDLRRSISLPLLGPSTLRLFGAYRFRTWNGSLGEQSVYSAYGVSLEDRGELPDWGQLKSKYFWRAGVGNFQGNEFERTNLVDLWRASAIASLNTSINLWSGQSLPATPEEGLTNTPRPIVPALDLNTNLIGTLAYFGDGSNQNTFTVTGGPTLTLGHFRKAFLDYTRFAVTGGITLRQGVSPLSFDRAVDLGTLNFGLEQQIAGPFVFSGGIGFNVDPRSRFYGDVTASYVELRWQRRSYDIGIFYSPYEGLGGIRVRLNDFGFRGSGVPFVPYHPPAGSLQRPF